MIVIKVHNFVKKAYKKFTNIIFPAELCVTNEKVFKMNNDTKPPEEKC